MFPSWREVISHSNSILEHLFVDTQCYQRSVKLTGRKKNGYCTVLWLNKKTSLEGKPIFEEHLSIFTYCKLSPLGALNICIAHTILSLIFHCFLITYTQLKDNNVTAVLVMDICVRYTLIHISFKFLVWTLLFFIFAYKFKIICIKKRIYLFLGKGNWKAEFI